MSLEQVKGFYQRLATDEAFRTQLKTTQSKAECRQVVKDAGYDFTTQEFEEYTSQMLELKANDVLLQDIHEKDLEVVLGGAYSFIYGWEPLPPYGHSPALHRSL